MIAEKVQTARVLLHKITNENHGIILSRFLIEVLVKINKKLPKKFSI